MLQRHAIPLSVPHEHPGSYLVALRVHPCALLPYLSSETIEESPEQSSHLGGCASPYGTHPLEDLMCPPILHPSQYLQVLPVMDGSLMQPIYVRGRGARHRVKTGEKKSLFALWVMDQDGLCIDLIFWYVTPEGQGLFPQNTTPWSLIRDWL